MKREFTFYLPQSCLPEPPCLPIDWQLEHHPGKSQSWPGKPMGHSSLIWNNVLQIRDNSMILPQRCSVLISILPSQVSSIWTKPSVTLNEQLDFDRHSDLQASSKELSMHCGDILAKKLSVKYFAFWIFGISDIWPFRYLASQIFGPQIFGVPLFHHMAWFPVAELSSVLEVSDEDCKEWGTLKIQHRGSSHSWDQGSSHLQKQVSNFDRWKYEIIWADIWFHLSKYRISAKQISNFDLIKLWRLSPCMFSLCPPPFLSH